MNKIKVPVVLDMLSKSSVYVSEVLFDKDNNIYEFECKLENIVYTDPTIIVLVGSMPVFLNVERNGYLVKFSVNKSIMRAGLNELQLLISDGEAEKYSPKIQFAPAEAFSTASIEATEDFNKLISTLATVKDDLVYRNINESFSNVQHFVAPSTFVNDTLIVSTSGGTTADVLNVVGDFLYIGNDKLFSDVYFNFVTIMSIGSTRLWEYLGAGGIWTSFTPELDGTNNWNINGVVNLGTLGGWEKGTVNLVSDLYWIRVGTTVGGLFTVEPTLRLCLPISSIPEPQLEIYALNKDTTPALIVDVNGGVAMGYTDASTYKLRVAGTIYGTGFTSGGAISGTTGAFTGTITDTVATTGFTHVGGSILNAPVATALIPNQNSPVSRFSSQGWNGQISKINAMDMYVNPDAEQMTKGRMCFKNTTVNGFPEQSELLNLSSNGNMNLLGRVEDYYDTFDAVQQFVGGIFTDIHGVVSSVGSITGDVLDVVGNFVYIGKNETFSSAFFRFDTIMSAGTVRSWEYLSTGSVWKTFTPTVDGTVNWSKDGSMLFTSPVDWITGTINTRTDLYWIRVGTVSGTFTVEPTLRLLTMNEDIPNANVLSNPDFDTNTLWQTSGDYAYTTGAYVFNRVTGLGTLRQLKSNFQTPAKPKTWYRMRYIVGVSAPSTTLVWIGNEFAENRVYFSGSTTEVDVYFRTNDNPQDFVIYTSATATSGFRIDFLSVMECVGGDFTATGKVKSEQFMLADLNMPPASPTALGTKGEIRITSNAIFVCVNTNTWVKTNLVTF